MWRERALKIVMALMMISLYFVLGIPLLIAVRNPAENRSLIAFAAWSSVAHASVMAILAQRDASQRELMPGVYILGVIAIALIVLFPPKKSLERPFAVGGRD